MHAILIGRLCWLVDRKEYAGYLVGNPGRSGYPNFSGRVVRVIRNSGNGKRYPNSAPKNHYPKFRVRDNLGSGIPELPDIKKTSICTKFQQHSVNQFSFQVSSIS